MAINIKLTTDNGTDNSKSTDYKDDKVPATQGNVIHTLNAYNEKLKKEYYDKAQARKDENALQSSLEKVIQLLEANTIFTGKTKDPNTSSEDTDDDRLEAYNGDFKKDSDKSYDAAGLVQKLNIIANLVSGDTTQANHNWTKDAHGNNVGKGESTGSVPVIGLTRQYDTVPYTAEFKHENNAAILEIGGLNTIGETDVSDKTVLSEKQVSEMIAESVKKVLGNYDSQISVMLSYMLFAENGLPKSYQYILQNTTAEKIQDAPMYVFYDVDEDQYSIKDLDGDGSFNESINYFFNAGNIDKKSITHERWKVTITEDYKNIHAYYNGSEDVTYNIPVPQKTLIVNLGQIDNETISPLSYSYNVFGGSNVTGIADVINGVATINVPVAAKVTITLPDNFDGELFAKYNYTDNSENNNVSITDKKFTIRLINDQTVYAKIIKYTLKLNNGNDDFVQIKRYKSSVTFDKEFDNLGKTGFDTTKTKLGGSISFDKILKVSIIEIQKNTEYANFTEGEIVDEIIWVPKTFDVDIVKVLWNGTTHSNSTSKKVNVTVLQEIQYNSSVDGYVLNGIFLDEDCTEPTNGVLHEVDSITELYARYDIIKYNYTFIANGAELPLGVDEVGQVDWASTMPKLPLLTRTGYEFNGWYTSPNFNGGEVKYYQKADNVYYAKWTEKTYTINFILKGDSLSESEKNVINPYFKYKSINVTTSNLPMIIGDPIADGFDFKGWSNGENIITQINLNSFQYTTTTGEIKERSTINVYATWEAQKVPVKEEIYYQIDGSPGEYDLAKTVSHEGIVGQKYVYKTNVNVVNGFEEVIKPVSYIVKDKDNVVKRYFNRKTYTISYTENKNTTGSESTSLDKTFTYPDNNVYLKTPNIISDGYSFASWVDENGSEVSYIPAYTSSDVKYTARYNQEAPVEGIDFSVNVTEDKITITKLKSDDNKTLKFSMKSEVKEVSDPLEINYGKVYDANSLTNVYGFVFFGEEMLGDDLKIVNASNYVNVLLKFKASAPKKDVNYTTDTNTRTITKMTDSVELEYRFGDTTGYVDFSSLTLADGQKIALRTKETFSRFASNDTSLIDFGDKLAPYTLYKEFEGIKNFEVTKKVSYNTKGEITIKKGVFEGSHGPLQYKTGTGNGWLNVTPAGNIDTILSIDRVGTVYFQYGEDKQYNAGNPIEINVEIQEHNVTFDLQDLKTKDEGYRFGDFTDEANLNHQFIIKVESGSQLCKCDDYIKGVTATTEDKKWGIYGYDMGSGERATTFLIKDTSPFNEASIIDRDITLNMNFVPWTKENFVYTEGVIIDYDNDNVLEDIEILPLTDDIKNNLTKTDVKYGQTFKINVIKNFLHNGNIIISNSSMSKLLDKLDENEEKTINYKSLAVKEPNKSYSLIENFTDENGTYTFTYTDSDVFDVRNQDSNFNYRFASVFKLEDATDDKNQIFCEFKYDNDHMKLVKIHAYGQEITSGFDTILKYKISEGQIDFYHIGDVRVKDNDDFKVVGIDGTITDTGIGSLPQYITVIVHSAFVGDEFKPCYSIQNIEYRLQTVNSLGTVITSVSSNGFDLNNNWKIKE
jgi:uncharacterized repeat protein (TIGR02543 family)